ncbi:MAG: hypothetical protein ABIT10_03705 [Alteraurantiacibacter sp.]
MNRRLSLLPACIALLLAACGGDGVADVSATVDHSDPLMAAALADQIMIDPDMVDRNTANQLASFAEADGSLPVPDAGPEAAAAARAEAIELVGGNGALQPVPDPANGEVPDDPVLARCLGAAHPSFLWAARMPQSFPVYPRGAVLAAAGGDTGDCGVRAISFATAVSVDDVLVFYVTRALAAGYSVRHVTNEGDNVLEGRSAAGKLVVVARGGEGGLTSVELVTLQQ